MIHDASTSLVGPATIPLGFPWTEHLTRSLVESLPLAVCLHDAAATIVNYNDRAVHLWGGAPVRGDLTGRYAGFKQLFARDGSPLPFAASPVTRVLESGRAALDSEVVCERLDGSVRTVLLTVLPVTDHGMIAGAMSCFHEVQAMRPEAAEGPPEWEAQARLCSNLAHDLANLFQSVRLNINLVKWRNSVSALDKALHGIEEAAERGLVLTRQLLATAGRLHLTLAPTDLNQLIDGMMLSLKSLVGPGIHLDIRPTANPWLLRADPEQLRQTILSLVANACEAMPRGGTVSITTANASLMPEGRPAGDYAILKIADTGPGMTRATMTRAFEPYFTTKTGVETRGLGLSAALGIVRQHGGELRIDGAADRGTVVTVMLPRSDGDLKAAVSAPLAVDSDLDRHRGKTILVVDDDPVVRAAAVDTLESYGFDVLVAANGLDALGIIRSNPAVDLLLADFQMRPMNGAELVRQARALRADIRSIMITGLGVLHPKMDEDVMAVLRKPLRAVDLVQEVHRALEASPKLSM